MNPLDDLADAVPSGLPGSGDGTSARTASQPAHAAIDDAWRGGCLQDLPDLAARGSHTLHEWLT